MRDQRVCRWRARRGRASGRRAGSRAAVVACPADGRPARCRMRCTVELGSPVAGRCRLMPRSAPAPRRLRRPCRWRSASADRRRRQLCHPSAGSPESADPRRAPHSGRSDSGANVPGPGVATSSAHPTAVDDERVAVHVPGRRRARNTTRRRCPPARPSGRPGCATGCSAPARGPRAAPRVVRGDVARCHRVDVDPRARPTRWRAPWSARRRRACSRRRRRRCSPPWNDSSDAMLTIDPVPAPVIGAPKRWRQQEHRVEVDVEHLRQSSNGDAGRRPARIMPALLTRMSTRARRRTSVGGRGATASRSDEVRRDHLAPCGQRAHLAGDVAPSRPSVRPHRTMSAPASASAERARHGRCPSAPR